LISFRQFVVTAGALLPALVWADAPPDISPAVAAAFDAQPALSAEALDAGRAGTELPTGVVEMVQLNQQELNATFTGNVATGNTTGQNSISEGAFQDASGFVTAIQNTGNNVLIQNSTIVNVAITP
jgi:hypothetical protein